MTKEEFMRIAKQCGHSPAWEEFMWEVYANALLQGKEDDATEFLKRELVPRGKFVFDDEHFLF